MRIKGSAYNGSVSLSFSIEYKAPLLGGLPAGRAGAGFHYHQINNTYFQLLIRIINAVL